MLKSLEEVDKMNDVERTNYLKEHRLCAYCWVSKAEGYVPQYKAYVCENCYEDHHGI